MLSAAKRKERLKSTNGTRDKSICNFCDKTPAALLVQLPVVGRKKRAATPYCLTCYYTTSAVRQDPQKYVSLLDQQEHERQLPAIQKLFSECFLDLQQELAEESARAFSRQKKDPLAAMLSSPSSRKKRKLIGQAPDLAKKQEGRAEDGGFLREIGLPEHLRKTQEEQRQLQHQQLVRMNQAASAARRASRTNSTVNQRRKGSGKSIWNLAMDKGRDGKLSTKAENYKQASQNRELLNVVCKCGSKDVRSFGNITSRNQEVRKGEIWGTGRGEEVINRYQCNQCGKTWNEVE